MEVLVEYESTVWRLVEEEVGEELVGLSRKRPSHVKWFNKHAEDFISKELLFMAVQKVRSSLSVERAKTGCDTHCIFWSCLLNRRVEGWRVK